MANIAFHHVALTCNDMKATESFYAKHFGFKRARVVPFGDTQMVFLRLGDNYLELFESEEKSPLSAPTADGPHFPGVRHLAFKVDDVDAKLADMGDDAVVTFGPFDFDDYIPGWRTVWLSDPDGNIVEVSQGFQDEDNPPPLE